LGVRFVILNAIDDAVRFYKRNSFTDELNDYFIYENTEADCTPMLLVLFEEDEEIIDSF
jgi:hypothetical protein